MQGVVCVCGVGWLFERRDLRFRDFVLQEVYQDFEHVNFGPLHRHGDIQEHIDHVPHRQSRRHPATTHALITSQGHHSQGALSAAMVAAASHWALHVWDGPRKFASQKEENKPPKP